MLQISCAFATSMDTPAHVAVAEDLGFHRAWLYDSPALYPDVWAMLALSAQRTKRIGLGPGVLIPSLRHPMTNAAAIAMLAEMAPGRVAVAIGSGFTGRMTMGKRPPSWKYVRHYVETLRALLRGEKVEWDDGIIEMMHPEGFGAARPIDVPMILGVGGPKGMAAAEALADGVFATSPQPQRDGRMCVVLSFGTVLGDDEDPGSERVLAAAGHAVGVTLHALYERGADLSRFPGGAEWAAEIDALPPAERHLAVHDRHLIALTERDEGRDGPDAPPIWRGPDCGRMARPPGSPRSGRRDRDRLPARRPGHPGELERFAAAAGI